MSEDRAASLEDIQKELEACRKEAQINLDGWKRAKADYLNLQKEMERQKQQWSNFTTADLLTKLLPVWISIEQLIQRLPDQISPDFKKGIEQIQNLIEVFFKSQGVEKIQALGGKFDPEWHEAVGQEKSDQYQAGEVIKEVSPGYKINNKLLIAPKVIVGE